MSKILVPFDGSENAMRALQHVVFEAKTDPGTEVLLLHVVDPYSVSPNAEFWQATDKSKFLADGEKLLNPAERVLQQAGLAYSSAVTIGSPGHEIASFAAKNACHTIVMGTRGASPVALFVIGSIAQRVVQLADVPVTLVK